MDLIGYNECLFYSYTMVNLRRVDLLARALGGGDQPSQGQPFPDLQTRNVPKGTRKRICFEQPLIDDYIAREAVKDFQDGKMIAKKSYIPRKRGK